MEQLAVEPHPLLDLRAFVTEFPRTLGEMPSAVDVQSLLSLEAAAPLQSSDEVRLAVRDLLRHGGFKPTGRNKPASEYLIKAGNDGSLATINVAVDTCNAVSLHSGLPISVVDLDRAREPFRVVNAPAESEYIFNSAGQVIRLDGLPCLFDADGPCANAVKDSQRTKTGPEARRTLSLIWGTAALPERAAATEAWYHSLLIAGGAVVRPVWP
jgi:DNA/RNA-binding domain of Phe-tRNA-synthetase-like protein